MAKSIERVFTKSVPLYDWATIRLVLTSDVKKSSSKRGFKDPATARTIFEGKGIFTIILRNRPTINDIAHESVHVAMQILHVSGVRFNAITFCGQRTKNDEALGYLVGFIAAWISTRLRKNRHRLTPRLAGKHG